MGREQFGPFAALLMGLTPSSSGSQIALSWKSQIYSLLLCLPMTNRWNMYKRYSGTTSRRPRSSISYPTSRACNLKYGHASRSSRVHSNMSKISIILPTIVSSAFRRPCRVSQHPQCLRLGSNCLDGSNDARERGSFPAEAHPLHRGYNNEILYSCLTWIFSSIMSLTLVTYRECHLVYSAKYSIISAVMGPSRFDACFLPQKGSTIQ